MYIMLELFLETNIEIGHISYLLLAGFLAFKIYFIGHELPSVSTGVLNELSG